MFKAFRVLLCHLQTFREQWGGGRSRAALGPRVPRAALSPGRRVLRTGGRVGTAGAWGGGSQPAVPRHCSGASADTDSRDPPKNAARKADSSVPSSQMRKWTRSAPHPRAPRHTCAAMQVQAVWSTAGANHCPTLPLSASKSRTHNG